MVDHGDPGAPGALREHAAAAPVKVAGHRNFSVVDDAGLASGGDRGKRDLHAEHAGAEHDDASSGSRSRKYPFRVVEVAQHGDPARKRGAVTVESGGIRGWHLSIAAHPGDTVERGNVGAGTGGEHEPVVGKQRAVAE